MQNMTDCSECKGMYEAASSFYAKEADRLCYPCITKWAESKPCGDCGIGSVSTTRMDETLKYRTGDGDNDFVELKCNVPLRKCGYCKFEFLDYETEQIHLATTNAYLISIGQKPQER